MKWVFRALLGLFAFSALAIVGLGVALVASAIKPARAVGVQMVRIVDGRGAPLSATIYYPARGQAKLSWLGLGPAMVAPSAAVAGAQHPLIIISHGTAGAPTSHVDTALALAARGFIVAAALHNGDNFQDQSAVGGATWISQRANEVVRMTHYMARQWRDHASVDMDRIGVFGFSAGATTALTNIGATPDFSLVAPACAARPEFVCQLMRRGVVLTAPTPALTYDARIKAAFLAAPGFGMAFTPQALAKVDVPVEIWDGDLDVVTPPATNASLIARLLPHVAKLQVVHGAGHTSFLAPCGISRWLLPAALCADSSSFDRDQFHRTMNAEIVAFFAKNLGEPS